MGNIISFGMTHTIPSENISSASTERPPLTRSSEYAEEIRVRSPKRDEIGFDPETAQERSIVLINCARLLDNSKGT